MLGFRPLAADPLGGFLDTVNPEGFLLSVALGDVTVLMGVDVAITGLLISSSLGEEVIQAGSVVPVTGLTLQSLQGSVTVSGAAIVPVTGTLLTMALGDYNVFTPVQITGMQMSSYLGDGYVISAGANVPLLGLSMRLRLSPVIVWNPIRPPVSPWDPVDPDDSLWTPIPVPGGNWN